MRISVAQRVQELFARLPHCYRCGRPECARYQLRGHDLCRRCWSTLRQRDADKRQLSLFDAKAQS